MQNCAWFLISKKTVVDMNSELVALKTAVHFQDSTRDKEMAESKIKVIMRTLDSGLHTCNVAPADYQVDSAEVEKVISFIDRNTVDDDFDVMNELKTMIKRL